MDNASRQVHNVMDILNALMEVMKSVAIALHTKWDVQMDNASQEIIFVMAILIAPMEQMEGLILIAIVHQTNSNV